MLRRNAGRIQHGADDLVIARAAAEIARQPVTHLVLAWLGVLLQQRLGGDDEAGRADAALQRRVFKELLLKRMQPLRRRDPFNGRQLATLDFDGEHEARIYEAAVENYVAGAAVAVVATLLGACEVQFVAQHIQEALPWLT